jgi:hypothetical protein
MNFERINELLSETKVELQDLTKNGVLFKLEFALRLQVENFHQLTNMAAFLNEQILNLENSIDGLLPLSVELMYMVRKMEVKEENE